MQRLYRPLMKAEKNIQLRRLIKIKNARFCKIELPDNGIILNEYCEIVLNNISVFQSFRTKQNARTNQLRAHKGQRKIV